ncbi:MAG: DUF2612 domain-containing protein [Synergistaceae bacterium]|jgi:hypothetical protein|nr:DUF2612 domain-containing protein [Synergistaceae bacterium]
MSLRGEASNRSALIAAASPSAGPPWFAWGLWNNGWDAGLWGNEVFLAGEAGNASAMTLEARGQDLSGNLHNRVSSSGLLMPCVDPAPFCWDREFYGWGDGSWPDTRVRLTNRWGYEASLSVPPGMYWDVPGYGWDVAGWRRLPAYSGESRNLSFVAGMLTPNVDPPPFCWELDSYGWSTGHWLSEPVLLRNSWIQIDVLSTRIPLRGEIADAWAALGWLTASLPEPVKIEDYTRNVPWQHKRPKFLSLLSSVISPAVDLSNFAYNMGRHFDVDGAVGAQLDEAGRWAGISRKVVSVPKGDGDGGETEIVSLPDHVYRNLVKAKIAANRWDGGKDTISEAWEAAFGDGSRIAVIDHLDMSMEMLIVGIEGDAVFKEILRQGLLPLRPAGVRISYMVADPADKNVFAWDLESPVFAGWEEGSWISKGVL